MVAHDHPEPDDPSTPDASAQADGAHADKHDAHDHGAHGREAHGPADSAGQPFAGRHFEASTSAFESDDGSAPTAVIEAIRGFRAGERQAVDVIEALRDARLLVALVAHAGDTAVDDHGRTVDKTQELSIVTVTAPDGRSAMPVFTSTEAMAAWNPKARPIPTAARRVALAAAAENTDLVIVDATTPTEFAVRRPALWAIAQGAPWKNPVDDPEVVLVFEATAAAEPFVVRARIDAGDAGNRLVAPEVMVTLELVDGLDQSAVTTLLARLHERWSHSDIIAARVDSLAVRLVSAPRLS